jgi:type III secretory pathway component EscU
MEIIIGIVSLILFVFLMRAFGAWMLRIDDVIYYQKEILKELKISNSKNEIIEDYDDEDENIEMSDEMKNVLKKATSFKK